MSNLVKRLGVAAALTVAALITGSALAPGAPASAEQRPALTSTRFPQAAVSTTAHMTLASATTKYYYPGSSSCLAAYNVVNGVAGTPWTTDLCRQHDPSAGPTIYRYYRNDAGPGAWFMKEGVIGRYLYYADALNWQDTNYYVWFRYPLSDPSRIQIAVTPDNATAPDPYENVNTYAKTHFWAWLQFALNDSRDQGVMNYVMNLAYQAAPSLTHPAQQQIQQNQTTSQDNQSVYQQLEQFQQQQETAESHQAAIQEYYNILQEEGNFEVLMARPDCDPLDIYSDC
jgi:hypothetical protein